ncbi:MAG: C40 family peptidase [Clostridiales bacterium]|nr:C40 family peptidase [Clostridiales bacterium]
MLSICRCNNSCGRAYDQKVTLANRGCLVSTGSRKVGYLIFFDIGKNAATLGIGHVGICMGDYTFIHADSPTVKSASYSSYYQGHTVAVCRPCNWFY